MATSEITSLEKLLQREERLKAAIAKAKQAEAKKQAAARQAQINRLGKLALAAGLESRSDEYLAEQFAALATP